MDDPGEQFALVARELRAQAGETATLQRSVAIATEAIAGCDHAGVTLVRRAGRTMVTAAATSEVATRGDQLQYDLGEGPCLDAIHEQETTSSPDLRTEQRWPRWARRAADDLGVRSMLCFQLFTNQHSYGGLNLYSEKVDAFDQTDQLVGLSLAANVAVALAASREIDQRDAALARRTTIGQAQGILMERFDVDAEQAFGVLARVSKHTNTKLFEIAEILTRTRRTPGV